MNNEEIFKFEKETADALAGFSDEELFSMVEQDELASEKITAPKYS